MVRRVSFGFGEARQPRPAKLYARVLDEIYDLEGVLQSPRKVRKELFHLLDRLNVELLAGELHALRVGMELASPDAQENVVHLGIASDRVVGVVGRDKRNPSVFMKLEEALIDPLLLRDAVVLQLEEDGVEDLRVLREQRSRLIHPPFEDPGWHLGREAPGETDDPFCVFL